MATAAGVCGPVGSCLPAPIAKTNPLFIVSMLEEPLKQIRILITRNVNIKLHICPIPNCRCLLMYSCVNDSLAVVFDISRFNVAYQRFLSVFSRRRQRENPANSRDQQVATPTLPFPCLIPGIVKVIALQRLHKRVTAELQRCHIGGDR